VHIGCAELKFALVKDQEKGNHAAIAFWSSCLPTEDIAMENSEPGFIGTFRPSTDGGVAAPRQ
jgi:hypothetical protein